MNTYSRNNIFGCLLFICTSTLSSQSFGSQIALQTANISDSILGSDNTSSVYDPLEPSNLLIFNSIIENMPGGVFENWNPNSSGATGDVLLYQVAYGDLENFIVATGTWANGHRWNTASTAPISSASISDKFLFDFADGVTQGQITINLLHNVESKSNISLSSLGVDWGSNVSLNVTEWVDTNGQTTKSDNDYFGLTSTDQSFSDSNILSSMTFDVDNNLEYLEIDLSSTLSPRYAFSEEPNNFYFMDNRQGTTIKFELSEGLTLKGSESGFYNPSNADIILPGEVDDGNFNFPNQNLLPIPQIFDPEIAIGYEFEVENVPFGTIEVNENYGDGEFDVYIWNDQLSDFVFFQKMFTDIPLNFNFSDQVMRFKVLGIEEDEELDPSDTSAFMTSLSFYGVGTGDLRMTPITTFVDNGIISASEPNSVLLLFLGMLFFPIVTYNKRKKYFLNITQSN